MADLPAPGGRSGPSGGIVKDVAMGTIRALRWQNVASTIKALANQRDGRGVGEILASEKKLRKVKRVTVAEVDNAIAWLQELRAELTAKK